MAAIINIAYNRSEIIDRIPGAEPVFQNVEAVINGIAFPVGVILFAILASPVTRGPSGELRRIGLAASPLPRTRRLCGRGQLGSLAHCRRGVSSGVVQCSGNSIGYILCSLPGIACLCGLIAAVYPFFGVAFFAARVLLPALIGIDA